MADLDRAKFLETSAKHNEEFAKAKSESKGDWLPDPDDYTVELVDARCGDKVSKDGRPYTFVSPVFRIADGTRFVNRRFSRFLSTLHVGILSDNLARLYDGNPIPEVLGEAMLGVESLKGTFFVVRVAESTNPNYDGKNVYINKCLGRTQEA